MQRARRLRGLRPVLLSGKERRHVGVNMLGPQRGHLPSAQKSCSQAQELQGHACVGAKIVQRGCTLLQAVSAPPYKQHASIVDTTMFYLRCALTLLVHCVKQECEQFVIFWQRAGS